MTKARTTWKPVSGSVCQVTWGMFSLPLSFPVAVNSASRFSGKPVSPPLRWLFIPNNDVIGGQAKTPRRAVGSAEKHEQMRSLGYIHYKNYIIS